MWASSRRIRWPRSRRDWRLSPPNEPTHGGGPAVDRGAIRGDVSLSLQNRRDRDAGLWHRFLRNGAAQSAESVSRYRGVPDRRGGVRRAAAVRAARPPPALRRPKLAGSPHPGLVRGRRRIHRVSHLSRAVRHPRGVPLVRRVGRHHRGHFRAHLGRVSPGRGRSVVSEQGGSHRQAPTGRALAALSLAALGVVYGDIGTSPLYALKECFSKVHGLPVTHDNVLGVLSLVLWSITFVVSF